MPSASGSSARKLAINIGFGIPSECRGVPAWHHAVHHFQHAQGPTGPVHQRLRVPAPYAVPLASDPTSLSGPPLSCCLLFRSLNLNKSSKTYPEVAFLSGRVY